ncbi:MAG: HAD-IIIC family phosphatase, partial [Chloroherpetonaceae bacterium]|nr:HAD-IIIC family phosphatase [Chloroherpetonaceae bacterium]
MWSFYLMRTFSIISDTTFDLILRKIESDVLSLKSYHFGSVVTSLLAPSEKLMSADSIVVHFDSLFHRYSAEELSQILKAVSQFAENYSGNVLVSNLWNQVFPKSLSETLGEYGDGLKSLERSISALQNAKNVYFYDFQKLISEIGTKNAYNFQLGHLYQMPYTKPVVDALAEMLCSYLTFLVSPEKKVIVVDCDDTLWSGIVGEDGLDKIQCDRNAKGIIHLHFQQFLKQKQREGFLLCLCSKNNEKDVVEAFEKKAMPLRYDDFIIKKINWQPKVQNIQEIAEELSLGLESFIFIDDSQFEIESVNKLLPEVQTFLFEKDYVKFLKITEHFAFKRKRLTEEDKSKTEQYRAEQARKVASET